MSLWMTPIEWAAATARHIPDINARRRAIGSCCMPPRFSTHSVRFPEATYSLSR